MTNIENINNSQNAKLGQKIESQTKNTELQAAFIGAYKQAEQMLSVPETEKKEKEKRQKKRGRQLSREDYENKDDLDVVLEEIDKRINQLLKLAEEEQKRK